MGITVFLGQCGLKSWLAASVLALLAGCATLPAPPEPPLVLLPSVSPVPVASPEPAAPALPKPAEMEPALALIMTPTLAPPAPSPKSRLVDFIAKRLFKRNQAPAPAAEAQAEPELQVDEKYRFTGEAARTLERGHASWYGGQFHGRRTASGENYDKYALTAAHKTLPFGTIVRVRSLKLGREVDVRINDRGPFAPGRVIDVSQAAAEALGLIGAGVAEVSLNVADSLDDEAAAPSRQEKKIRKTRRRAR
ncbi:MAG: rare lipoprotein [Polaromonas sp.]|nr:rare lipoprotein [Polaromonas sp.]